MASPAEISFVELAVNTDSHGAWTSNVLSEVCVGKTASEDKSEHMDVEVPRKHLNSACGIGLVPVGCSRGEVSPRRNDESGGR